MRHILSTNSANDAPGARKLEKPVSARLRAGRCALSTNSAHDAPGARKLEKPVSARLRAGRCALMSALLFALPVAAQDSLAFDKSGNGLLKGVYNFRQVVWQVGNFDT